MQRVTIVLVLVATLVVAGACSSSKTKTTSAGTSTAADQTRAVQVDGKADSYNGDFAAYFPNAVTVRPGDSVDFHSNWRGEPHTVTLGKLVDAALPAAIAASQNGAPPPAFQKLPTFLSGAPGDVNQNAAQPCYLAAGEPPSDANTPCPKAAQPEFNGTQAYYNSGFLPDGDSFKVKLAANTAPGTYHYYCNFHGAPMSGTITVVGKGAAIPTATKVDQEGKAQKDAIISKEVAAEQLARAGKFPVAGVTNVAGYASPEIMNAAITEFIPTPTQAKVGQAVTWAVVGVHTISFKAPANLLGNKEWVTRAPDGSVHSEGQPPVGGPGVPTQQGGPPPSGGLGLLPPVNLGIYDGAAYRSSGLIVSTPPQFTQVSLTFTKAGTYSYTCLLHPGMDGVVQVT